MKMILSYGSVCSGIEAASVAWKSLEWKPVWFSEIEPFPSEVLNFHYPQIPNLGDMKKIYDTKIFKEKKIDLLVGGTPCQSFSLAGSRRGLEDPRGDLALEFLKIVNVKKPKWFIWENVPGILSSNKGKDFETFFKEIQKLGYGFAYRILDAQYFGVPQRRRRVFVVGHYRGWLMPTKVLFDGTDVLWDTSTLKEGIKSKTLLGFGGIIESNNKAREKRKVASTIKAGYYKCYNDSENLDNLIISKNGKTMIRRLTPVECERLQGFPDNYTKISWKGKDPNHCPDGPRYKAIGNSMAIPVMQWIGKRISENSTCFRNTLSLAL